jgi:two-component system alkaline phosphatase synthesis response regulator PhoP
VSRTVLVVDDEPKIREVVHDYLVDAGFSVAEAADGERALERVQAAPPDLVVLDLGLPGGIDGLEVVRRIRERSSLPIIVLTARGEEIDRVVGLELGADDYLVKPFSPRELVARVKAVLRRTDGPIRDDQAPIVVGPVRVDPARRSVTVEGVEVALTATEFELVAHLASQPGRVFTRAQLLEAVHGEASDAYGRAVDAHVKNVRRKIEPDPHQPRFVLTVHGVGYRFAEA